MSNTIWAIVNKCEALIGKPFTLFTAGTHDTLEENIDNLYVLGSDGETFSDYLLENGISLSAQGNNATLSCEDETWEFC